MEALGISPFGIVAYTINFVVLVVLLRLFLYKPVSEMLTRRRERISEGLVAAERVAQEAALQRIEFEKELARAREVSQTEARKAAEVNEKMRQDILQMAKKEAEEIKAKAKEEAELQKQQVVADLQKLASELAMQMTRKIVSEGIDDSTQHKLVDQFLTGLGDAR